MNSHHELLPNLGPSTPHKDPFVRAHIEATQNQIAKSRMLLAQAATDGATGTKLLEIAGQIVFLEGRLSALVTV